MNHSKCVQSLDRSEKWLYLLFAILGLIFFFGFAVTVSAAGATQISGIGYFDESGDCADPEGAGSDFATVLDGDLEGCQYVFVETWECSPSGTYRETGYEVYVIDSELGTGTFRTTYKFSAKFEGCTPEGFPDGAELFGRCQHPITAGTGTGDFEGVTGRLDFKDDIEAGNFPYRGHLKW
ncbi:MAG: hypothetical protein DWQ04_16415 [Chloroflexi bacterium]|nr:MAG: hypothetical protein DWQ04_16415 [Chloroflexota bacterium]